MRILARAIIIGTVLLSPGLAFAQSTVGNRLSAIVDDVWNPFFLLVAVCSAIGGLFMFARGMMKLVAASGDRSNMGFGPGLVSLVIAAALLALPDAAGMGMTSILGSAKGGSTLGGSELDYGDNGISGNFLNAITGGKATVGGVQNCLDSSTPAACMAQNIATNVIPMAVMALFGMVFIFGLIIFAMTLVEIAKGQENPNQAGKGAITKLVTAVLLMNAPLAFGLATRTMLGMDGTIGDSGLNTSSELLKYPTGSSLEIVKKYTELIGHSFTILTFFGAWAFVRGIFMIKSLVEGRGQQGSFGMAGVYIVAGVLMANAKPSTCFILNTVGGASMAAGFCG